MLNSLLLSVALVPTQVNIQPVPLSADYVSLHNTVSDSTNFNVEVMRGLVHDQATGKLWAINAYESSLLQFDLAAVVQGGVTEASAKWRTLTEPVSIADHGGHIYVLGQGTHALAKHDKATGQILDIVKLPSEPADLVIDEANDLAYISCMGSDSVVEVALGTSSMTISRSWVANSGPAIAFQMKRPRFLSWDATNSLLYVVPFLSGNNTIILAEHDAAGNIKRQGQTGIDETTGFPANTIFDGYDSNNFPNGGLPDIDLFVIDPNAGAAGTATPVARRAGALLTAHGIHPGGDYWMAGIDSLNTLNQTEPEAKGQFARNTLAILSQADLASPGQNPLPEPAIIDLDFDPSLPGYDANRSLPFPYAIEFEIGALDWTAIASSTLGRVHLLGANGAHEHSLNLEPTASLPGGDVVRDMLYIGTDLYVYCQQTSNILVWEVTGNTAPSADHARVLSLGNDPTPIAIAKGRGHFYDATVSEESRFTCATCHPSAESDMLVWHLKEGVEDFKDPMVTQPLKGLQESFPFHWRGERGLHDFNGAFEGLLGAAEQLDLRDFEDFEAFIFSLRPAANPLELLSRRIPDSNVTLPHGAPVGLPGANPANGLAIFNGGTCNSCHFQPTGSNGSTINDNGVSQHAFNTWNRRMESIQFSNFLAARNQPMVRVRASNNADVARPLLGGGHRHNGVMPSIFSFIETAFGIAFPSDQDQADLTSFIMHLDTGTPPAAHHAVQWNRLSKSSTGTTIKIELTSQAMRGWIDLIAFGTAPDDSGVLRRLSWLYDPGTGLFKSDDQVNASIDRPLDWFGRFSTVHPELDNVFIGVLPGQGQRLGLDFDYDGLENGDEVTQSTNRWNPDFDSDTFPDGYELTIGQSPIVADATSSDSTPPRLAAGTTVKVAYVNSALARLEFETNEPCRWLIRTIGYQVGWPTTALFEITSIGPEYGLKHSAEVHGLLPSTSVAEQKYVSFITLFDLNDNQRTADRVLFSAREGDALNAYVLGELELTGESWTPGGVGMAPYTYSATAELRVDDFSDTSLPPASDVRVIAQLLKRSANGETWTPIPAADLTFSSPGIDTDFLVDGKVYTDDITGGLGGAISGPFVVLAPTLTGAGVAGTATLQFDVANLSTFHEEVQFNIVAVVGPGSMGASNNPPDFEVTPFFMWNMPKTLPSLRRVVSTP